MPKILTREMKEIIKNQTWMHVRRALEKAINRQPGRKLIVMYIEVDADGNITGRSDQVMRMWPDQ